MFIKTSSLIASRTVLIMILFIGCQGNMNSSYHEIESVPSAEGLTSKIMGAMGGQENWDNTRYVYWDFFKRRKLLWDKWTGNVRIESVPDSTTYLLNVNTLKGKILKNNLIINNPDTLEHYCNRGKEIWINDSYWLVMPFKLNDPGVKLAYVGRDTTLTGIPSYVLELSFDNVGVTPENKYRVFVDEKDYLVKQWSYYESYQQETPSATWPWDNYSKHGKILLSGDRSDDKGPGNVKVFDELPDSLFSSFSPININLYKAL
jgi:hypothetical protein